MNDLAALLDDAFATWNRLLGSDDLMEIAKLARWETFGEYAASRLKEAKDE